VAQGPEGEIGLGLREFAQKSGIDPGNLSKYERGVLPPPQDEDALGRLAGALKLKKNTEQFQEFTDLAAASAGRIPPDLAANPRFSRGCRSSLGRLAGR